MSMNRREALGTMLAGAATAALAKPPSLEPLALQAGSAPSPGTTGTHTIKPLAFDPAKLPGFSEKLLRSHHENNYAGAVKNLNLVEAETARITKATPGFVVSGLKERELTFTNSVILHEHYFSNLGGDGKASGAIQKALADAFGSFGAWEENFRATGMSLAGGSGWVVLDFDFHTSALRTFWSGSHTQSVAFGAPLLVMDMFEHAYQMDFGAAAAKYIETFFRNLQWDAVNRRFERAREAAKALKG